MKTTKKLEIKKVTLQNLDEPTLDAMAGGYAITPGPSCVVTGCKTCPDEMCK